MPPSHTAAVWLNRLAGQRADAARPRATCLLYGGGLNGGAIIVTGETSRGMLHTCSVPEIGVHRRGMRTTSKD